jgi:hypothetical protein
MSTTHINQKLRQRVVDRADGLCEYCLIREDDTFFGCEIDHIISEKHGGATSEENLAYASLFCNRLKGSDTSSLLPGTNQLIRFFNPRTDLWSEHFAFDPDSLHIVTRTSIGEATARIFGFNQMDRLTERHALAVLGRYPRIEALRRIQGLS